MEEKKMINAETVESAKKRNAWMYRFLIGVLVFVAVVLIFAVTSGEALAAAAICLVAAGFIFLLKVKRGPLTVYFSLRAVTDKRLRYEAEIDADDSEHYMLVFGDRSYEVNLERYNKTNVEDRFYVMYNARNDRIVEVFEASEYEIDPSLDIR